MEEHKIKISIIVPVYNVESCLGNCLDSLLSQDISQDEYEIILIDDESKDNSLAICKEYAKKYPFIHIYTQKNAGASVARTKGIEVAKGEYLFFVDSDDYIANNLLNKLYNKAQANKCDILFFNFSVVTENGETQSKTFPHLKRDTIYTGEYLATHIDDYGSLWKGIYSREFIKEKHLEFTKGIIHQDSDFNMRAYPSASRIMIADDYVYFYRYIGESATRTKNLKKLKLILHSDFVVIKNIKVITKSNNFSNELKEHYNRRSNSMMIASIFQLYKLRKQYGEAFFETCFEYSWNNGLLPIKGRTNSWKTTLLIPLINIICLLYKK